MEMIYLYIPYDLHVWLEIHMLNMCSWTTPKKTRNWLLKRKLVIIQICILINYWSRINLINQLAQQLIIPTICSFHCSKYGLTWSSLVLSYFLLTRLAYFQVFDIHHLLNNWLGCSILLLVFFFFFLLFFAYYN